jgi:hypothetical protein
MLKITMASGFGEKADGVALYSAKLCNYLERADVNVRRANLFREGKPVTLRNRELVHIQFGMQFFRGRYGAWIIPYILRLKYRGSRVIVTIHDIPMELQISESLSLLLQRTKNMSFVSLLGRLAKLSFRTIQAYAVLTSILILANKVIVHTEASKKALFGLPVLIPHGSDPPQETSGLECREPLVLTFGIIHRSRRVDWVMKELSDLPVQYIVAGASKDPGFVHYLSTTKTATSEIVLTHPPLDRIIQAAWIIVIPPSAEKPIHASGVVHTAASFGKPILTPPTSEATENSHFFVIYHDEEDFRGNINRLVNNTDERRKYCDLSKDFASKTAFSRVARMHKQLYASLQREDPSDLKKNATLHTRESGET